MILSIMTVFAFACCMVGSLLHLRSWVRSWEPGQPARVTLIVLAFAIFPVWITGFLTHPDVRWDDAEGAYRFDSWPGIPDSVWVGTWLAVAYALAFTLLLHRRAKAKQRAAAAEERVYEGTDNDGLFIGTCFVLFFHWLGFLMLVSAAA